VARCGSEIQAVELFQFPDLPQTGQVEGALSFERVENDAFKEVTERQIVIAGKGAEDLQNALFHADAGLHPFDYVFVSWYQCTKVPL
jgi:hypothetical protein